MKYLQLLLLLLPALANADCVILLHGLARTAASMNTLQEAFEKEGYRVANIDYPSRQFPIEQLAPLAIEAGIEQCGEGETLHFVTHSLGGILVRVYLHGHELPQLGRVVMIAPPNQGSEVVDRLAKVPGYIWYNGPAGLQLGTGAGSVPRALPAVSYPVGVIAGNKTFNLLLSQFLPNPDDGKVSVASTQLAGMSDFVVVEYSHPFIMERAEVIQFALRFIKTGHFSAE